MSHEEPRTHEGRQVYRQQSGPYTPLQCQTHVPETDVGALARLGPALHTAHPSQTGLPPLSTPTPSHRDALLPGAPVLEVFVNAPLHNI